MSEFQVKETATVEYRPDAAAKPAAEAKRKLGGLELPRRGDSVARLWAMCGILAYIGLAITLFSALVAAARPGARIAALFALFGFGESVNVATLVLVLAGILLTAATTVRVFMDIRTMKKEETDIDWVEQTGRTGLPLVFVEPALREPMRRKLKNGEAFEIPEHAAVETLIDDRVRSVHHALSSDEGASVVPQELRAIAEVRTSQYGGFARYAASLLLLLAVLGTFAGVKTALPGLIESISASTNSAGTTSNDGLIKSLDAVAGAFGGNALALIGAIAVGLMAQGIGFGRRNLLERLELVSARHIYLHDVASDANPMQAAIIALRDTAREMHSSSGAMLGIEAGLQTLGNDFRASFDGLADRMHDIVARQEEGLYEKTADSLHMLQVRVTDLAQVMEANAKTYAGLAEAVRTRSQETDAAITHMRDTNRQLAEALEGILRASEQAKGSFDQLAGAVQELRRGSDGMQSRMDSITNVVAAITPAMQQIERSLASTDERLRASEQQAQQGWLKIADQVAKRLDDASARVRATEERAAKSELRDVARPEVQTFRDEEMSQALRGLANAIERDQGRSSGGLAAAGLALLGVVIGGGLMYVLLRVV